MATYSDGPTANSTSSGATLDVAGVTAAIGDLLILWVAADNAGTSGVSSTSTSITDGAGNTWTSQTPTNYTAGAANDGTALSLWTCLVTATLSSDTITVNFSPNTTAKAAAMQKAVPDAGCAMVVGTIGPGATSTSTGHNSGAVSTAFGETFIGACAIETNGSTALTTDSDTTNGSWSTALTVLADTGTSSTSQTLTIQRKTVTATGNQSYGTTTGSGRDAAHNYLLVYETLSGTLAATEAADAADIDGAVAIVGTMAATERPDRAAFTLAPGWPDALPLPTLQGYAFRPAASVERRQMDVGAARVYRRTRRPVIDVSVAWQVNAFQQALLDGFQASTLGQGARSFAIELLLPSGLAMAVAKFKDKLAIKARGGPRWQTTATLEILTRPMMTDAALTALLDDDGDPPAWPTSLLPYPTLDGGEFNPKPATIRSEDRPGLPHARQRSRNSMTETPAAWELSAYQATVFDAFFHWRGLDGAQWFSFPLVQAIGTTNTMVRFIGEADWTPRGAGRWGVSAPLEIRERRIMTEEEVSDA